MDDMDFTQSQPQEPVAESASAPFKAASSKFYDYRLASRIFEAAGKTEKFAAGKTIFEETQKASAGGIFSKGGATRMYFLAEGEVTLTMGGRKLDTVTQGDVFGEMAVISERPRSASATAAFDCTLFSMNAEELKAALARDPEFALMLMSVMFDRLRFMAARLVARKAKIAARQDEAPAFGPELLAQLEQALPRTAIARHQHGAIIMKEGQSGAFMYVVKSGRIAIAIGGKIVEMVNPGGTFGEMALVDQSPRTATAGVETECELLAIDRAAMLEAVRIQPAFGMALLKSAAERLRHMNSQLG